MGKPRKQTKRSTAPAPKQGDGEPVEKVVDGRSIWRVVSSSGIEARTGDDGRPEYREAQQDRLDSPAYVSDDEEVRRGQEAWSRLKKDPSWADWISVGKAHLKGRQAAMREACTNKPTGRRYNQIFGEWLTRHGFDDIDKGDRSRLFEVIASRRN